MNEQDLKINTLETNYKSMSEKIDSLTDLVRCEFAELKKELKDNYVSKDTFLPVKILTYGFAGILFTIVIGALISNVLIK